ncbi:hypothetical protein [Microbacterium sp. JZ31]|uniref:hypothetical protein n=1 Tax=Microbacterium sp. JZ31 TaxID=1906274 RepID=UPI00193357FF|nr:hypothetical protein [Microbacterium sp. JZ31]
MGELLTMVRIEVRVNDRAYLLAQRQDYADLQRRFKEAAQGHGAFVDFTVVGNRAVSVLINRSSRVTLSSETVQHDPRDTGDEDYPYGDPFDGI